MSQRYADRDKIVRGEVTAQLDMDDVVQHAEDRNNQIRQ